MAIKLDEKDFSIAKENKKDFRKTLIARANLTNHFTIEDVEDDLSNLNRMERELKSQISLSTKVVENVATHHPYVAKLSDEQLKTAAYLHETKDVLSKSEAKYKEVKNAQKRYKAVLELIYSKFNFTTEDVSKK